MSRVGIRPNGHFIDVSVSPNGDTCLHIYGVDTNGMPSEAMITLYGPGGGGFGSYQNTYQALGNLSNAIEADTKKTSDQDRDTTDGKTT